MFLMLARKINRCIRFQVLFREYIFSKPAIEHIEPLFIHLVGRAIGTTNRFI